MTEPIAANPRPAATVIVLRDTAVGPEVFMVRRHEGTAFMGGAHVFPGGRVDEADHLGDDRWCDGIAHATSQLPDLSGDDAVAYYVAAARELFEEAGVLLARTTAGEFVSLTDPADRDRFTRDRTAVHSGETTLRGVLERERLRLALDVLIMFAHWVTPPIDTRQFDTRFFVTRVPPHQTPVHDDTETTHSVWMTPAVAIAQSQADAIVLPPPTWSTLRELEPFTTVDQALASARTRRVARRQPALIEQEGVRMLVIPGDPLHAEAEAGEPLAETRFVFVNRRWRAERVR